MQCISLVCPIVLFHSYSVLIVNYSDSNWIIFRPRCDVMSASLVQPVVLTFSLCWTDLLVVSHCIGQSMISDGARRNRFLQWLCYGDQIKWWISWETSIHWMGNIFEELIFWDKSKFKEKSHWQCHWWRGVYCAGCDESLDMGLCSLLYEVWIIFAKLKKCLEPITDGGGSVG